MVWYILQKHDYFFNFITEINFKEKVKVAKV